MTVFDPMLLAYIRSVMLPLPGITEGICFSTPAFYVQKKLLIRLREDGYTMVAYHPDRDLLIKKNPGVFFITNHYQNYPCVLVQLAAIDREELQAVLVNAWKSRASKKYLKLYELSART